LGSHKTRYYNMLAAPCQDKFTLLLVDKFPHDL
jgi:hypothetical protein